MMGERFHEHIVACCTMMQEHLIGVFGRGSLLSNLASCVFRSESLHVICHRTSYSAGWLSHAGGYAPEINCAVAGGEIGVAVAVKIENVAPALEKENAPAAVVKIQNGTSSVRTENGVPAPEQDNGAAIAKAAHDPGTVKMEDDTTSAKEGEDYDAGHDGWQVRTFKRRSHGRVFSDVPWLNESAVVIYYSW